MPGAESRRGDRFISNRGGPPVSARYELAELAGDSQPVGSPLSVVWSIRDGSAPQHRIASRAQRILQHKHRELMRQQMLQAVTGGSTGAGPALDNNNNHNGRRSTPVHSARKVRANSYGRTSKGSPSILDHRMSSLSVNTTVDASLNSSSTSYSSHAAANTHHGSSQSHNNSYSGAWSSTPSSSRYKSAYVSGHDSMLSSGSRVPAVPPVPLESSVTHDLSLPLASPYVSSVAPAHVGSPGEVDAHHLDFGLLSPIPQNVDASPAGSSSSPARAHRQAEGIEEERQPPSYLTRHASRPLTSTPLASRLSSLDDVGRTTSMPELRASPPASASVSLHALLDTGRRRRTSGRNRIPLPAVDLDFSALSEQAPVSRARRHRLAHRVLDFPGSTMCLTDDTPVEQSPVHQDENTVGLQALSYHQQQQMGGRNTSQRRKSSRGQKKQTHQSFALFSGIR